MSQERPRPPPRRGASHSSTKANDKIQLGGLFGACCGEHTAAPTHGPAPEPATKPLRLCIFPYLYLVTSPSPLQALRGQLEPPATCLVLLRGGGVDKTFLHYGVLEWFPAIPTSGRSLALVRWLVAPGYIKDSPPQVLTISGTPVRINSSHIWLCLQLPLIPSCICSLLHKGIESIFFVRCCSASLHTTHKTPQLW